MNIFAAAYLGNERLKSAARTHENARREAGHHQKDRVIDSDR
jgi:hypothetical protein